MTVGFHQLNAIVYEEFNNVPLIYFLTVMSCPSVSSLDPGGVLSYAPHSVIKGTTSSFLLSSFLILTVSCSNPSHKRALLG